MKVIEQLPKMTIVAIDSRGSEQSRGQSKVLEEFMAIQDEKQGAIIAALQN